MEKTKAMRERFVIAVWHGESGSIGTLWDRRADRCLLYTSTIRDGGAWMDLLRKAKREREREGI